MKFLANSLGQDLSKHLIAVGSLSSSIISKLEFNKELFNDKFTYISFLTGLFHDIGKLDPSFQKYIHSKIKHIDEDFDGFHDDSTLEKRANHQELSWAILNSYDISLNGKKLEGSDLTFVSYSVFWHHKKTKRENDRDFKSNIALLESLGNDLSEFNSNIEKLVTEINAIYKEVENKDLNLEIKIKPFDDISEANIPPFKKFNAAQRKYDFTFNARNTILRSALIAADRSISTMQDASELEVVFSSKNLDRLIDRIIRTQFSKEFNIITDQIKKGLNDGRFNDIKRNQKQAETSNKLHEKEYGILAGPPGCGKTKIALDWVSKKNPQKVIWVCPRVNICQSIFTELSNDYLPNSKIEILTGEFKETRHGNKGTTPTHSDKYFNGDFIVTTIDSLLSRMTSNNNAKDLPVILNSVFIFDEYHEFMNLPGMIFLFKELMYLLQNIKSNYLLMSATPNPFFLKKLELKDFDADYHIVKAWDFNQSKYQLKIDSYSDFKTQHPAKILQENAIFIYNSVQKAQEDYISLLGKEKSILFHSSFTKEDKNNIFNELMKNFGKNKINNYQTLRAGPIVQASLNISQDNLYTDICSPENLLQRFGRCNRFGKDILSNFIIFKPDSRKTNSITAYLNNVEYSLNSSFGFVEFIREKLLSKEFSRQNLADLYYEFHDKFSEYYELDYINLEKQAFDTLSLTNAYEPLKFLTKKKKEYKENILSGGFRGSSIYILPLKAFYFNNKIQESDEYLWDLEAKEFNQKQLITSDPDSKDIEELIKDLSNKGKHLNSKKYNKYNSSILQLSYRAKSPDSPIYANYSDEDLKKTKGIRLSNYLYYIPYDNENKISLGLVSKEFIDKYNNQ